MPITPIEMYTMTPKSQEASFQHRADQIRASSQEQQYAAEVKEHVHDTLTKTTGAEKSENEAYRYDAKEKGNGSFRENKGNKKKDEKKEGTEQLGEKSRHGFDVRI